MKEKALAICLGCLVLGVLSGLSTGIAGEPADQVQPAYTVVPIKQPPVIDGKLDDDVWKNATFTYLYDFLDSTKEARVKADPATTFAISADDKQLYVAFRCQDTNVSKLIKNVTTRDGKLWNGDNVEIFLNFEGHGPYVSSSHARERRAPCLTPPIFSMD